MHRRGMLRRKAWLGAGLIAGLILSGLTLSNVALGQTEPSSSGPDKNRAAALRMKAGAKAQRGFGMRDPIHGEFVVRNPEGGYRTLAVQRGEATSVENSSITVRSEDGFLRTYAVTGDTKVNRDGKISDIKQGEEVGVMARVEGGNATAVRIVDEAFKRQKLDRRVGRGAEGLRRR